jgi:aspartate racemase
VIFSVDFAEIERMQAAGAWDEAGAYLGECARRLQAAGAQCVLLCTNTMHLVYDAVQSAIEIPMLHLVDGTADALILAGVERVALLGTRYTMELPFYRRRLEDRGLTVMVPEPDDRETVHRIIYDELCRGQVLSPSRTAYQEILARLAKRGAQAVILGCTEIGLLIGPDDSPLPVFDSTLLHVEAALDWALAGR